MDEPRQIAAGLVDAVAAAVEPEAVPPRARQRDEFEGMAGPYPVSVIVRTPNVIPGLADVLIRVRAKTSSTAPRSKRRITGPPDPF